jgi:putative transposase
LLTVPGRGVKLYDMPRRGRSAPGGRVYHVLNRGNGRRLLFYKDADYKAFEKVLEQAAARTPLEVLGWCLMPNHWHLVLRPRADGQLSEFMHWLTVTHTQRHHAHFHKAGQGHLYQGRFKSFPVQEDHHFLMVMRYVERNALRAGRVERAQDWRWSSLWRRERGTAQERAVLSPWPVDEPAEWIKIVNRPQAETEEQAVLASIDRSRPFGSPQWLARTAAALGLEWTIRPRGRPRVRPESNCLPCS